MANTLGRNIKENEVVVIAAKFMRPFYHHRKWRLVRVMAGFGMSYTTMGTALSVEFLEDGERDHQEGTMIDKAETVEFQAEYGVFGEKYEVE